MSEEKGKECFLEKLNRLETENQDLKKMSNELEPSMHYLEQILEDGHDNTLYLYDEREREYNNEAVKCIMNLTDLRVASQKVGPVIKEVAELCGKYQISYQVGPQLMPLWTGSCQ